MQVRMPARGGNMYPDALIVCGQRQLEDDKFDTLLNPCVIFEILSPSARSIDKGRKFFFYLEIFFYRNTSMIDSQKKSIGLARKQADGAWRFEEIKNPAPSLFIRTIDFNLPLEEIYTDTGL
jgi:Uma2 family endonuclease